MSTTKEDLSRWFDNGLLVQATHMIIVCDTYDYEDFPVYVYATQDVKAEQAHQANKPMQKIMEIYNLSLNKEVQLNEPRSYNI